MLLSKSVSADIEALQVWLDEFLDVDCKSEVFEVMTSLSISNGLSSPPVLLQLENKTPWQAWGFKFVLAGARGFLLGHISRADKNPHC